jgi:hypothetical protein
MQYAISRRTGPTQKTAPGKIPREPDGTEKLFRRRSPPPLSAIPVYRRMSQEPGFSRAGGRAGKEPLVSPCADACFFGVVMIAYAKGAD